LGLGLWQGCYQQTEGLWLRWYDAEGWIPTLAERVQQEQQRVEEATIRVQQEQQRAEEERQKAERLANYLRSQGIDPDNLP
ncbi:MAG: hypothetical protein H0X31_23320, partial [Nostocaceae cyanobacterium]|nr:hypothetical protein [Nostocaceae cyanobacterium]